LAQIRVEKEKAEIRAALGPLTNQDEYRASPAWPVQQTLLSSH